MPGEQSQGRVQPHDPAETVPQHPQKTVGGHTLVAVLLRRKLRRSAYRRNTPVHRTAANAALTAAKDAYGVRAILPRPEEAVAKGYTAERDGFFRPDNSSTYKAELFRFVPVSRASEGRGFSRFLVSQSISTASGPPHGEKK